MSVPTRILLLSATALTLLAANPALAQDEAGAPAQPMTVEDLQAQMEMLTAQVEALQKQLDTVKDKATKAEKSVSWKGAPQFTGADGFTFKVRGRVQYDAGMVSDGDDVVNTKDLGFQSYFRRVRLGVEGSFAGDFKYKAEFDFANSSVGYGDVLVEYAPAGKPFGIKLGNMETNYSLEQMSSSRFTTFIERAQMTEAFYAGRKLGGSVYFKAGDFRLDTGLFNTTIGANRGLDDWVWGTRAIYTPKIGETQLHLGASYQHRSFNSADMSNRVRSRPFIRSTDFRFVDTGNLAIKSDNLIGIEAAAINGPWHAALEWQRIKSNAIEPADVLANGDATTGTRLRGDPVFNSGYVEVGYLLTGETRGYKAGEGTWDRVKVANPINKGGMGAWSINARLDYLDLDDKVSDGTVTQFINGGKQYGYGFSVNWMPVDYVKFVAQYIYVDVKDVVFATANPAFGSSKLGSRVSTTVDGSDSFSSNVFALRAQIDW